ncbi:hypothetical protein S7335_700 [Synechococcus sp. PCC 7335]|uniref:DUF3122 domain-containing protein n=1 Tax=Synechococcus sp. (strain ATCC 29403 / PCC 7335) TaxID=91464 RepID=UPI00017EB8FB|nr:DUF3122 domain-containing protein [Synechococcus sp. PCC 7335]EDX83520.1 hypothetical protein S7335_700 [Synechococcus sp. PCC 7335]
MWKNARQLILRVVICGIVVILCLGGVEALSALPATAAIRQLEEAPGQVVYQSRQTLQDQHGNSWQAIAFKRIRPGKDPVLFLRLVAFPGIASIDRSHPLVLTNSLGNVLTADDASARIFTDEASPEPNVGQYDLAPIISELQPILPLKLSLPTTQSEPVEILVPSSLVEEWKTL